MLKGNNLNFNENNDNNDNSYNEIQNIDINNNNQDLLLGNLSEEISNNNSEINDNKISEDICKEIFSEFGKEGTGYESKGDDCGTFIGYESSKDKTYFYVDDYEVYEVE